MFRESKFDEAFKIYCECISFSSDDIKLKSMQNAAMIHQIKESSYHNHDMALFLLDEVIDSPINSWKSYLLRATSKLETLDLMGAKLDIEEASKRLKNSDEKTGSNKKRLKKMKDKIDAAFEIKKPERRANPEEVKQEDAEPK